MSLSRFWRIWRKSVRNRGTMANQKYRDGWRILLKRKRATLTSSWHEYLAIMTFKVMETRLGISSNREKASGDVEMGKEAEFEKVGMMVTGEEGKYYATPRVAL
ncbi:hypothetical protein C2S51_021842 [Perilla frutescens var. frutescens]|nr:hypothetical protein C2S51_021842 [Perilla frutescens var. frutescens]